MARVKKLWMYSETYKILWNKKFVTNMSLIMPREVGEKYLYFTDPELRKYFGVCETMTYYKDSFGVWWYERKSRPPHDLSAAWSRYTVPFHNKLFYPRKLVPACTPHPNSHTILQWELLDPRTNYEKNFRMGINDERERQYHTWVVRNQFQLAIFEVMQSALIYVFEKGVDIRDRKSRPIAIMMGCKIL